MEWGYSTRRHYICDCSLEGIVEYLLFLCWKKKHREKTKSTGITPGISTLSESSNLFRSDNQWKVSLIPLSHAGPLIFLQPAASSGVFPAPGSDGVSMLTK